MQTVFQLDCTAGRDEEQAGTWRSFVPALSLAICSCFFLLCLALRTPLANEPVALLFGPTVDRDYALQQVVALDGRIVRVGGWNNVVVAVFDRDIAAEDLRRHGAWISMNPVFLGACDSSNRIQRSGFSA